mmetsp:Transcript_29668/g.71300  ORF Transcript_29668/g.71300 Transcript_29668/m.71300 type:complete len:212 (-) Transcript_29668:34-669(-)
MTRAAVDPGSPEIVGLRLHLSLDDRGDAVDIQVLEPHRLSRVHVGPRSEIQPASIHHLGGALLRGVYVRVRVQCLRCIIRVHAVEKIHIPQHHSGDHRHEQAPEHVRGPQNVPLGVPLQLSCAPRPDHKQHTHASERPSVVGVVVADLEGHNVKQHGEYQPRQEDAQEEPLDIQHSPAGAQGHGLLRHTAREHDDQQAPALSHNFVKKSSL